MLADWPTLAPNNLPMHILWLKGCTDLHGQSTIRASIAIHCRVENEVRALYSLSDQLPTAYCHAFDIPSKTLLLTNTTHLQSYLAVRKAVIALVLKIGHVTIIRCHKPLTAYFPPKPKPPPKPNYP